MLKHSMVSVLVLSAGSVSLAQMYSFEDPGTLGGTTSFARSINNLGQVTGNAQTELGQPNPRLNAFVWEPGMGPMVNLGVLPGSNNFSRGYAINDSGVVVGESDNNFSQAFRWDSVNGMTGLTRLAGDNFRGVAHGINNTGVIVGISGNGVASRPTRWGLSGAPSDLGSIDGLTTSFGRAWAINDSLTAVGVTRTGVGTLSQATMWFGQTVLNLGSLQPDSLSEAFSVNSSNVAVGAAVDGQTGTGTAIRRAVRWELVGGVPQIQDLGSLGRTFSEAKAINDAGVIVGFATNISGLPQVAWIWDDGVMVELESLVLDLPSGWTLTSAEGINNNGDIVGFATFNGQSRGFVLWAMGDPACYANCDGSTIEPILNVDDFTCFINEFAAGTALPHEEQITHYSNCDGSTVAPVLNVDDFTCFINAFAQGCP